MTDATLGTVQVQYVKIMDGTLDGTSKAAVGASGLRVNIGSDSVPVTGTFWQTTQPVSGTFWQATQPVSIATMPSTPVTGTFWQTTQPVSEADGSNVTLGSKADAAGGTGSQTLISIAKQLHLDMVAATPQGSNTIGAVQIVGNTSSDGSTTISAGGTAQNLFSGTTPTNGFEVCNPDATNDLWVSDSTTAAANGTGSYRVAANGGTYTTPVGYKPIQAVSIVGAVTGQKITARRW